MSRPKKKLEFKEESNFQYLLSLLVPLNSEPGYEWLPELFSIIGHEDLIKLCKYAGGCTIKIPTLEELTESMEALDWYYKVYISHTKYRKSIPPYIIEKVNKIKQVIECSLQ